MTQKPGWRRDPSHRAEAPLTYCGFFDDQVARNPGFCDLDVDAAWRRGIAGEDALVESWLLGAAIAGYPVAINDGYLLQHPQLRRALMRLNDADAAPSVFSTLASHGFVRVLRRAPEAPLEDLPREAKARGVTTLAEVELDAIRDGLRRFDLIAKDHMLRWPDVEVGEGFHAVMRRVYERVRERADASGPGDGRAALHAFTETFERFEETRRTDRRSGPRTQWEAAARAVATERSSDDLFRLLMHHANACYHVNFANCLRRRGGKVLVETAFMPTTVMFVEHRAGADSGRAPPPKLLLAARANLRDERFLRSLILPDGALHAVKQRYLEALDRYYAPGDGDERELREASLEYERKINEHFKVDLPFPKDPETYDDMSIFDGESTPALEPWLALDPISAGLLVLGARLVLKKVGPKLVRWVELNTPDSVPDWARRRSPARAPRAMSMVIGGRDADGILDSLVPFAG